MACSGDYRTDTKNLGNSGDNNYNWEKPRIPTPSPLETTELDDAPSIAGDRTPGLAPLVFFASIGKAIYTGLSYLRKKFSGRYILDDKPKNQSKIRIMPVEPNREDDGYGPFGIQ